MIYYYQIAGIRLRVEIPFEMIIAKESPAFLTSECEPDMEFCLVSGGKITMPDREGTWMVNSCYYQEADGYAVYHCPVRGSEPYARVTWSSKAPRRIDCVYVEGKEQLLCGSNNILGLLGLETVLLQHKTLLLHSSFIRWEGKGILFTAPSGTGKSTQADLWEKFNAAQTLNGDRAALRSVDGVWHAFGLPYAGSSGIYRNECAPVAAIVVLRQAKENRIHRISSGEAMRYIYPELTLHRWDTDFVSRAIDLFLELAAHVPVYLLECLPDEGAVRCLEAQLSERGGVS